MSTLKINFDFENMSDASIDNDDFANVDELNQQIKNVKQQLNQINID